MTKFHVLTLKKNEHRAQEDWYWDDERKEVWVHGKYPMNSKKTDSTYLSPFVAVWTLAIMTSEAEGWKVADESFIWHQLLSSRFLPLDLPTTSPAGAWQRGQMIVDLYNHITFGGNVLDLHEDIDLFVSTQNDEQHAATSEDEPESEVSVMLPRETLLSVIRKLQETLSPSVVYSRDPLTFCENVHKVKDDMISSVLEQLFSAYRDENGHLPAWLQEAQ